MSKSFADLGVSSALVSALGARGIDTPFAIQKLVIPDVLAGHDVLAKSPTGSGKTLAFAVPMVQRLRKGSGPSAGLVLAPTRELALQIVQELEPLTRSNNMQVVAVYGGAGIGAQISRAKRADIVVATPGRLEDLIARGAVKLGRVQILVLDEADRMLDMGFLPVVKRIVAQTPDSRQTLMFSATLDGAIGKLADAFTRNARRHDHAPAERHGTIIHRFVPVAHEAKLDTLVAELKLDGRGRTLVFVRTKRGADRLVKRLRARGCEAAAMHGDKSQSQREKALHRFHTGQTNTLVATDVAARGIDVEAITHVINFDAPADHDTYVHRVGRTGRAGSDGIGVTFVMAEQADDIRKIAAKLGLGRELEHAGLEGRSGRRDKIRRR